MYRGCRSTAPTTDDLSVSCIKIGKVLVAQDDLSGAIKNCRGVAMREPAAKLASGNANGKLTYYLCIAGLRCPAAMRTGRLELLLH